jgi:copper chaperone CopZ
VKTEKVDVNEYSHIATVTFDDEKTTLQQIIDALEKAGFPIDGPPKFLN